MSRAPCLTLAQGPRHQPCLSVPVCVVVCGSKHKCLCVSVVKMAVVSALHRWSRQRFCGNPKSSAQRHALAARPAWMEPVRNIGSSSSGNPRCLFSTSELALPVQDISARPFVLPASGMALPAVGRSSGCGFVYGSAHATLPDAEPSVRFPSSDSFRLSQCRETVGNEFGLRNCSSSAAWSSSGLYLSITYLSSIFSCYSSIGCVCVTQLQRPSLHLPSTSVCTCTLGTPDTTTPSQHP